MNRNTDAPAPQPKKVNQAEVQAARERAAKGLTSRPRGMVGRTASLLTGGYGGYGEKDTLG